MAARTTSKLVQDVLLDDYGPKVDGVLPDLTPYIASANALVNRIAVLAPSRAVIGFGNIAADPASLELVERWLAAHFYCLSDKPLASKSSGGASGSFQGQTGKGFESTNYGLNALRLDYSGILEAIDKRKVAGAVWLGKTIPEQLSYDDRN